MFNSGVLIWKDPIILDPKQVPLIFGSSQEAARRVSRSFRLP